MLKRVLIVEDDPLVARGLLRCFKRYGWDSMLISDPRDVDKFQHSVDVILTDWSVGGAEVIRRAIKPVVVYSGESISLKGIPTIMKPAPSVDIISTFYAVLKDAESHARELAC